MDIPSSLPIIHKCHQSIFPEHTYKNPHYWQNLTLYETRFILP